MSGNTRHQEMTWEESIWKEAHFSVELNPRSNSFSFPLRSLGLEITTLQHCSINIFQTFFADRPAIWALDCEHRLRSHNHIACSEGEQSLGSTPLSLLSPDRTEPRNTRTKDTWALGPQAYEEHCVSWQQNTVMCHFSPPWWILNKYTFSLKTCYLGKARLLEHLIGTNIYSMRLSQLMEEEFLLYPPVMISLVTVCSLQKAVSQGWEFSVESILSNGPYRQNNS